MNPALMQLKDIHLPKAIHPWPIAPGWIILYLLLSAVISYFIYSFHKKTKERRIIHVALTQLKEWRLLMQNNPDNINIAANISTLIRRTAIHYFNRDAIAGLSGKEWLHFLNQSGHTTAFNSAAGQLLIDAPYRKHPSADLSALFLLTENWLSVIAKNNKEKK